MAACQPTASAKVSMVLLAVGEWARYGKQVITYSANAPPRAEQLGVKEREAPQRIHDYWASVGHPERSDNLSRGRKQGNDAHGKLQASSRTSFYPCACPGVGTAGRSRKTGNNRSASAKPPNSTVLYTASPNRVFRKKGMAAV